MKTTKLGHTNFLGSPEALKEKTHEKIFSYKKGMAKIKKTLQEQEDVLIQQKAKLDKKLKAVQNKLYENKLLEISELVFKYKLYDYDLEVLDAAFEKMSLDLKSRS